MSDRIKDHAGIVIVSTWWGSKESRQISDFGSWATTKSYKKCRIGNVGLATKDLPEEVTAAVPPRAEEIHQIALDLAPTDKPLAAEDRAKLLVGTEGVQPIFNLGTIFGKREEAPTLSRGLFLRWKPGSLSRSA